MARVRPVGSAAGKPMHEGEVAIDEEVVRRLVGAQFPHLAGLPIRVVRSTGTVNAIYRLGDELCARLPRVAAWAAGVEREVAWLPKLAPRLSLRVPEPVALGHPASGYPFSWAIFRWIEGRPFGDDLVCDERRAATELARFVAELRRIDPAGAPRSGRRPLNELDAATRRAIASSGGAIDGEATAAAWANALRAPPWDGPPVWIHTDLLRPNLLVDDGRLCAVIDFGGAGVGDPAADVIAAWTSRAWTVSGSVPRQARPVAANINTQVIGEIFMFVPLGTIVVRCAPASHMLAGLAAPVQLPDLAASESMSARLAA